jgi:hypothetical protein
MKEWKFLTQTNPAVKAKKCRVELRDNDKWHDREVFTKRKRRNVKYEGANKQRVPKREKKPDKKRDSENKSIKLDQI